MPILWGGLGRSAGSALRSVLLRKCDAGSGRVVCVLDGFGFEGDGTRAANCAAGFGRRRRLSSHVEAEIMAFDRVAPVEEAVTPPSSWYTSSEIFNLELERVFERRWQVAGLVEQLMKPGDFFTGKVGRVRYVVCMDDQGNFRAFHNVCRHHAAAVATGSGCTASFVCPYHGWTYGLDGRLLKATRLGGIRNFTAKDSGLRPLWVGKWGPFVLISLPRAESVSEPDSSVIHKQWVGSGGKALSDAKIDSSLRHVAKCEYVINCNWKVFCDNYLDGGYHVPHAHGDLASVLNLKTYKTTLFEKGSIQTCGVATSSPDDRYGKTGGAATYAFIYPNFMINRYGPWMDTNLVLPINKSQCRVVIDFFLEQSALVDEADLKSSIQKADKVQHEDIALCEAVQDGLQSPAFDVGRYAPKVEYAMHHFHVLLHEDLCNN